jgi:uracil-DNA glycosylase
MTRDQLRNYLEFYRDLGIRTIYKPDMAKRVKPSAEPASSAEPKTETAPISAAVAPVSAGSASPARAPVVVPTVSPSAEASTSLFATTGLPGLAPENDTLDAIRLDIGDCRRCRLCETRMSIVFGSGNEQAKVVFVGEGPGADEDEQGVPFVGRAGQLLTQMIDNTAAKEGIPISRKDVYICNVVKCRPPENRTPLPDEMATCGQFLYRQLTTIKPKAICALGATAMKALLNTKEGITKVRGQWHKWRDIPVMITYHPSYLLRQYNQEARRQAWQDLKALLHYVYD